MTVVVTERPGGELPEAGVREAVVRAVQLTLERAGLPGAEVSLALVDDGEIARLNREYRGVEGPTDVLSFPLLEQAELEAARQGDGAGDAPPDAFPPAECTGNQSQAWVPVAPPLLLGDVVISLERAGRQAEQYGHSLVREVAFLAVHGTLHLLGYDHEAPADEARMMSETEAVLAALGLGR